MYPEARLQGQSSPVTEQQSLSLQSRRADVLNLQSPAALICYMTVLAAFVFVAGIRQSDAVLIGAIAVFFVFQLPALSAFWVPAPTLRPAGAAWQHLRAAAGAAPVPVIFVLFLVAGFLFLGVTGAPRRIVVQDARAIGQLLAYAFFLLVVVRHLQDSVLLSATAWCLGLAALASIIVFALTDGFSSMRLTFLGRNNASNSGSASLAIGGCAALGLLLTATTHARHKLLLMVVLLSVVAAAILSGARGTILALGFAGLTVLLSTRLTPRQLLIVPLAGFLLQVLIVLGEEPLRAVACDGTEMLCRNSHRLEIWQKTLELIAQKPWLGWGTLYRLPFKERLWFQPHNGVLAIALAYGIPAACLFVAMLTDAFLKAARLANKATRLFCISALCFTFVRMAVDTPMPLSIGRQYLYFLLPLILTYAFYLKETVWRVGPTVKPSGVPDALSTGPAATGKAE